MKSIKKHKTWTQGFTLIEIILGMMIFAILGLGLLGSFTNGLRLNKEIEAASQTTRQLRWVFDGLSRDLDNVRFYDFAQSYPKVLSFSGGKDRVRFLIVTDEGLKWISYYIGEPKRDVVHKTIIGKHFDKVSSIVTSYKEENASKFLIRQELPFVDGLGENESEGANEEVVLRGVKEGAVTFEFAAARGPEEQNVDWKDSWEEDALPTYVRIGLTLDDDQLKTNSPAHLVRQFLIPMGLIRHDQEQASQQ